MPLTLRAATKDDLEFLFALRNDPGTRAMSRSTAPLTREEHTAYLDKQLHRSPADYSFLFIAELDGVPVGTGRLDRGWDALALKMDSCIIGYTIAPTMRGQGFGKLLVTALVERAKEIGYMSVTCRIRRENLRSIACAARAGVNSIELF